MLAKVMRRTLDHVKLTPVRTACAVGLMAYSGVVLGWRDNFTAPLYEPARNVMPLPVWAVIGVLCSVVTLIGLHTRPLAWRATYCMPQFTWMMTWSALQLVAVINESFGARSTPGGPVIWMTISAMFIGSLLHDREQLNAKTKT